jgi:hypothetical protein
VIIPVKKKNATDEAKATPQPQRGIQSSKFKVQKKEFLILNFELIILNLSEASGVSVANIFENGIVSYFMLAVSVLTPSEYLLSPTAFPLSVWAEDTEHSGDFHQKVSWYYFALCPEGLCANRSRWIRVGIKY